MRFYFRLLKQAKNSHKRIYNLTILGFKLNKAIHALLFFWVFPLLFSQQGYTQIIPKTNWSLVFVDSQELVGENVMGVNAFDGKTNMFWHTKWFGSQDPSPPHEIQINVGSKYNVSGIRYQSSQDGEINGQIKQ